MSGENHDIVYGWWCNLCWAVHCCPEQCPFDDIDDDAEEYYYSLR